MNKKIAFCVSVFSLLFGLYVILKFNGDGQGGEGVLFYLGIFGAPASFIGETLIRSLKIYSYNVYVHSFFYFLQYQLIAFFIYRYGGSWSSLISWSMPIVLVISMLLMVLLIAG